MTEPITLRPATTAQDLEAVRTLCWTYRDFLLNASGTDAEIVEAFYPVPKYISLMDRIAEEHARPQGTILLALLGDEPVGCGMTHALDAQTSEIKRVYVTEGARGRGVAAQICTALEDQARADGYTRMVLDTSKNLTDAQRLYARLGYALRGPYQPLPPDVVDALVFFEKPL